MIWSKFIKFIDQNHFFTVGMMSNKKDCQKFNFFGQNQSKKVNNLNNLSNLDGKGHISSAVQNLKEIFQQAFTTNNTSIAFAQSRQTNNYTSKKQSSLKCKKIGLISPSIRAKTQNQEQNIFSKPQSVNHSTKSQVKIKWACLTPAFSAKSYKKSITQANQQIYCQNQKDFILKKIGQKNSPSISKLFKKDIQISNEELNLQKISSSQNKNSTNQNLRWNCIGQTKEDNAVKQKKFHEFKKRDIQIKTFESLRGQVQARKKQINKMKEPWIVIKNAKAQKIPATSCMHTPINKLLQIDCDQKLRYFKK